MNDKNKILFDQYDLQINYTKRGRGETICVTNQGLYALSKTKLSSKRLEEEYQWKEQLINLGMKRVDQYVRNKEESFISYDKYYEPFVMRRTYEGVECNVHSLEDLRIAAKNLAIFHNVANQIEPNACQIQRREQILESYEQHKKELTSIYKFIRNRKNKGDFEYLFLEEINHSWHQVSEALEQMKYVNYRGYGWCHGAYNHHNVLLSHQGITTLHLERFYYGYSILDLYHFLRKVLEKNEYDFVYCTTILDGYKEKRLLNIEDYRFLYLLFLYPEKFWNIANQYMNHKKFWVLPRYLGKLKDFVELQEKRAKFLGKYSQFYNVFSN